MGQEPFLDWIDSGVIIYQHRLSKAASIIKGL